MRPADYRAIAELLEQWAALAGELEVGPAAEHFARAAAADRHPSGGGGEAARGYGEVNVTRTTSNGEVIRLVKPYISEPGDYDASEEAYSEADASELGERVAGAIYIENDAAPDVDWRRAVIKARARLAGWLKREGER